MKDRYLFKGKRLDNGEWIFGFLSIHKTGKCFIKPINVDALSSEEIDKNTICSCTGLKDKNGKLIWENDIIAYRDCTEEKYVIAWELDKACFEYQQYSCSIMNFDELSSCEVEVIGNIFDNPELLESEG